MVRKIFLNLDNPIINRYNSESMTFLQTIQSDRKLVRVQEKGQVTLPSVIRRNLGLKKGDLVAVVPTDQGVLISSQEIVATKTLDKIGQALKEKGLSLTELIESGREIRGSIIEKKYGLRAKRSQ